MDKLATKKIFSLRIQFGTPNFRKQHAMSFRILHVLGVNCSACFLLKGFNHKFLIFASCMYNFLVVLRLWGMEVTLFYVEDFQWILRVKLGISKFEKNIPTVPDVEIYVFWYRCGVEGFGKFIDFKILTFDWFDGKEMEDLWIFGKYSHPKRLNYSSK